MAQRQVFRIARTTLGVLGVCLASICATLMVTRMLHASDNEYCALVQNFGPCEGCQQISGEEHYVKWPDADANKCTSGGNDNCTEENSVCNSCILCVKYIDADCSIIADLRYHTGVIQTPECQDTGP